MFGLPMGFDSTHGKHVDGNTDGKVKAVKKRKHRQYMNKKVAGSRPPPEDRTGMHFVI
jgi:U4/U6.U5 tri-snRNP-associated protein 3